jgi:hypothetical protein
MPLPRSAQVRNAPRKRGGGFRNGGPDLESFVAKWRQGLKKDVVDWEGLPAVAELKGKEKIFDFLLAEGQASRATQHLFQRMVYLVRQFRWETQIRLKKQYFDEVDEFLRDEAERIQKVEKRIPLAVLKTVLKDLRSNFYKTQGHLIWIKFKEEQLRYGFWEELIWEHLKRRGLAERRLDLDTVLQIELGKALAFYLQPEGVSLRTIARLVLLAYSAGELSTPDGYFYKSAHTGRRLKLRNIYDNLRHNLGETGRGIRSPESLKSALRQARRSLGIPPGSRIGALSLLYLSRVAPRLGLTERQIRSWIRRGRFFKP